MCFKLFHVSFLIIKSIFCLRSTLFLSLVFIRSGSPLLFSSYELTRCIHSLSIFPMPLFSELGHDVKTSHCFFFNFSRYVLDYLRNLKLVLPENFHEKERLKQEAEYFNLTNLVKILNSYPVQKPLQLPSLGQGESQQPPVKHSSLQSTLPTQASQQKENATHEAAVKSSNAENAAAANSNSTPSPVGDRGPGYITVGYRGTFAFGRDGLADVKFRKLSRIIVCGKVSLCREVFKDTLNESRDPDRGENDRYTSRFFLKHSFLEQAFDMLQEEGFCLVGSCGSGTNSAGEIKPGMDTEEAKWQHYNEFIFERH